MPRPHRLIRRAALIAPVLLCLVMWPGGSPPASGLPSQQSLQATVAHQRQREAVLSAGAAGLGRVIAQLSAGLSVLEQRVASVQSELDTAQANLAQTRRELSYSGTHLLALRRLLARNRHALANELRAQYTQGQPELVDLLLSSTSFSELLDSADFLHRVAVANAHVVEGVRHARDETGAAAVRLSALQASERVTAIAVGRRRDALSSLSAALQTRRDTVAQAQAAQLASLQNTVAGRHRAEAELRQIAAQQAQAISAAGPGPGAPGNPGGPWAIPWAIVQCESGGQNLPPNSAGASGYYQFLPATWRGLGGSTPSAYQASKSEQDRLAAQLWAGGAGASNWVCSALVKA